jgi:hypothetical protein
MRYQDKATILPREGAERWRMAGRFCALLLFAAAIAAGGGSRAADFAIFDQSVQQALPGLSGGAYGQAFVTRAKTTLNRAPAPTATITLEGTLPGDPARLATINAMRDLPIMFDQAVAYRVSGDKRHLATFSRYLDAWLKVYKPGFNPIDETGLDVMILGFDLTREDLDPALRDRMLVLMRTMAEGYLADMEGKYLSIVTNWQSHRVKLATMAAYQTGDAALIERAKAAYQRQVDGNIYADGTVYDFYERDAILYLTYDINALMIAALGARGHGADWFTYRNPAGGDIPGVLAWLRPYALGEQTHQEFVKSKIRFDAQRAAAGEAEYSGLWNPTNGLQSYALGVHFNASYRPVMETLVALPGAKVPEWIRLLCVVKSSPQAVCPASS